MTEIQESFILYDCLGCKQVSSSISSSPPQSPPPPSPPPPSPPSSPPRIIIFCWILLRFFVDSLGDFVWRKNYLDITDFCRLANARHRHNWKGFKITAIILLGDVESIWGLRTLIIHPFFIHCFPCFQFSGVARPEAVTIFCGHIILND